MNEDLQLINQYSKTELTEDQVYTFSVLLCDNDVDRDYERFTTDAVNKLAELFVGKTGIFDHNWTAEGQTARVYRTEVVHDPERMTAAGDEYVYLKAYAYLLRTDKNADLIAEIEGGIKKEVSIGCSVSDRVCSVCGETAWNCKHLPGHTYDGQLCYFEFREPTDAYEFSFVAVPAQRAAGVQKSVKVIQKGMSKPMTVEELREKYPDLVKELSESATAVERQRLQEIDDIASAVNPELVKAAKYDEPCTAAELSHRAVLEAAKQGRTFMANAMKDYEESGAKDVHALPADQDIQKKKTPEEKQQEARMAIKQLLHPDTKEEG